MNIKISTFMRMSVVNKFEYQQENANEYGYEYEYEN